MSYSDKVNIAPFIVHIWREVEQSLAILWTCRHCGHQTPIITEFCDGCGIEDCHQGHGEEWERDKALRLAGHRGSIGLWT